MEKKKTVGLTILGWTVIISGILTIWFSFFFPVLKHTELTLLYSNLLSSIAIFPRGFPYLFAHLLNSPANFVYGFGFIWMICIIFCGLGILFLKDIARKAFIGLNSAHILTLIIFRILSLSHLPMHHPMPNRVIDMLIKIIFNFLIFLVPILYIVYLTRSKIKEQFSKEGR